MLDNRRQETQQDKDEQDCDVQSVLQQKLFDIECVLVVFPLLLLLFGKGEFGKPEQVDQMVPVSKSVMLPVLNLLKGGDMFQLGVKKPVFENILFLLTL